MKSYRGIAGLVMPALLVAGCLMIPNAAKAADADSAQIGKLLADAKVEAFALKADAEDMESFTSSNLSWLTYAKKIEMIKEHVGNSGRLLSDLRTARAEGSTWQQTAIDRIGPYLADLAANTEATNNHIQRKPSQGSHARIQGLYEGKP